MLVGRKIPPWPKDAGVFVDGARVQVGEDVNVIARPVLPVPALLLFKCRLIEPLDLATQEHLRARSMELF